MPTRFLFLNICRYYLSAAGNVLDRLERDMIDHPELAKAQAELARGWIYYALRLFDASKTKDIDRICNEIFRDESSSSGLEFLTAYRLQQYSRLSIL